MNLILEGSKLKSINDFHNELKIILDLPDYYGHNMDALWDCLTGCIDLPLTLVWKDFEVSQISLGVYATKASELFEDAAKQINGFTFSKE